MSGNAPVQIWPESFAERYRAEGWWTGETFPAFLRSRAADHGDRLAVTGPRRLSYRQLLDEAEANARRFAGVGLRPGDRVVMQLPNGPDFLPLVFGLFCAGLIPVYALPAHRDTEIAHFLQRSEAAAYLIEDRFEGFDYRELAGRVAGDLPVFVHGEGGDFTAVSSLPDTGELPPDPDPQSVAFLQISGGSTGLSKLIPRTHDDYLYSVRESARICGLTPDDVFMTALPAAHNFPMSSPGFLGALSAGAAVLMCPNPAPQMAFELIAEHGVTMTGLVPPLALNWLQAARVMKPDLSSLRVMQVGGAKLIPEVAARIGPELGCQLQQVFGMAEGLVNYTRLDDPEDIVIESQGRPISPGDEVLVLDDDGNPVAEGQPGNLLTRGPYTIRAYHNEPAANARSFTEDGFYRTGDIVKRLPSGHLVVQGRAGDHINRAGEKISAEEIEDHLLAHPGIFDAAVVSVPDDHLGERSCAFIIPEGEKPRVADIRAFMRGRGIAAFKIPDQIVFTENFETTAVGKISRKALRAALRDQLLKEESA
ncbi:(2,3-dihydroxybenzoyl)adenylate synthase [Paracoccus aerodenitrificans]|uniref:(2,3-dihydroxybenzoyl)adenylate synthase n=1 Tax=Paracoccus aerodenitrificans TaxID=3017781 RepID=UPI0022F077AD|nr:AMP-binding protein [Paracoccus aerodenitrificans]WBU62869.1 AMP-binding protein [Paracoccus aerodenitrificans]